MAILGDFEVTIVVNGQPLNELDVEYPSRSDRCSKFISATNVDFAIDYKVKCGFQFDDEADFIVFRTKFDGAKYGTAHVPRARFQKPGSYRVRKSGRRRYDNGGWHFIDYAFFTADFNKRHDTEEPDMFVPRRLDIEVWREREWTAVDQPLSNGTRRRGSSGSDYSVIDLTNPLSTWGQHTTKPPKVRHTRAIDAKPLVVFTFENRSPAELQLQGLTEIENALGATAMLSYRPDGSTATNFASSFETSNLFSTSPMDLTLPASNVPTRGYDRVVDATHHETAEIADSWTPPSSQTATSQAEIIDLT